MYELLKPRPFSSESLKRRNHTKEFLIGDTGSVIAKTSLIVNVTLNENSLISGCSPNKDHISYIDRQESEEENNPAIPNNGRIYCGLSDGSVYPMLSPSGLSDNKTVEEEQEEREVDAFLMPKNSSFHSLVPTADGDRQRLQMNRYRRNTWLSKATCRNHVAVKNHLSKTTCY